MGQARRRGSFEVRLSQAVARNECLRGHITDKPVLEKYSKAHGMQRLSTRLIQDGLMAVTIQSPTKPCEPQKSPSS